MFHTPFRITIKTGIENGNITQSNLVIKSARQSDEGNYTCKPSSISQSASSRIFVIGGKIKIEIK